MEADVPAAPPRAPAVDIPATPPPQPVFVRDAAPSPVSPDPIDFLSDPFAAQAVALTAAIEDDMGPHDEAFSLPSCDPRNHREALTDVDSAGWHDGEKGEFLSFLNDYKVFHLVDRSSALPAAKILTTAAKAMARRWDRLNEFAVSSIIISCQQRVIHHLTHCPHDTHRYWVALGEAFALTDAQGALRLLCRFCQLSLPSATPNAFDMFSKEVSEALSALKAADVDLDMVYSSHLLVALPPVLDSLQTTISVSNPVALPNTDALLELIRNEILRFTVLGRPPGPCLHCCEEGHWGRSCPKRARPAPAPTRAPAPAIAGNLAELLLDEGVEAWLASAMLPPPSPHSVTLDSGASHAMCGDTSLFANLRRRKPSPVGGIGGTANALIATGVSSLCIQLHNGQTVTIKNALLVEGLSTVLISSGQLWDPRRRHTLRRARYPHSQRDSRRHRIAHKGLALPPRRRRCPSTHNAMQDVSLISQSDR
ncbi:hypothetical protein JCM21900_006453 [Sporobolomyces salmonicolor]